MLVVHVHVHVVPESLDAFLAATRANAEASLAEPGVLRFDVVQNRADPTHVVLVEVYRDAETAPAAHKATTHYATWRDAVAPMMAQPRSSAHFHAIQPDDEGGWRSASA